MRNNVFKLVSSYTSWLIANYQAIAKINAMMPVLRLVSEKRDKNTGEFFFKIQIAGKNIFPVLSLEDLKNPAIISNFSKNDQDIIQKYLSDKKQYVFCSIVARTYNKKIKHFHYTIEYFDIVSKIKRYRIIDNLSLLLNEIENFDAEDKFLIKSELNK